jgi:hypothetical protein
LRKIQNGSYYSGVMDVAEGYTAAIESDSYSYISGDLRELRTANSLTVVGSTYSDSYYDRNNTAYYLDPAGTSNLGGLTLAANVATGRSSYGSGTANLVLLSESTYGRATIDFRSGVNYPSDGAQIYYETATNLASGETSRLVIRTENDADDSILIRGGFVEINSTTVDGGSTNPGFRVLYNGNARLYTYSDNTTEFGSFRAPIFYDSNNTGYYTDQASTSNYNVLRTYSYQGNGNVGGTGNASWHPSGIYSAGYNWLYGGINGGAGSATNFSDVRANIFYDYQDTGYYADPNDVSHLNITRTALRAHRNMTGYGEGNWINDFSNTPVTSMTFGQDKYNGGPTGTWWFQVNMRHNNGSNLWGTQLAYGWEDNANEIYQRNVTGGSWSGWVRYLNSNNYSGYSNFGGNAVYGGIYYDGNDTTYYMDYNSTTSGRLRGNLIFNDYGAGIVGTYSDVRYQAVFSMGAAYLLPMNGTSTGNLYGIAWSHPNMGGIASNLADHGMLILQNGAFRGAWGGGRLVTTADIRGTIYYDYNDTGYYVDPNSNSRINNIFADRYFTLYNNFGDTINNAPWYGLGGSNIGGPFGGSMVQLAGYYGLRMRSANVILELDSPNYSTSWAWFSSPVAINNQMRAHSFYDYNDTAYYVDPNGTSRLVTLQVNNAISAPGVNGYAQRIDNASRTAFTVGGNSSTFYPVVFSIGTGATVQQYGEFVIERGGYDDPGYSGIGFSNCNIRFTVKASGWGFGATYENVEGYHTTFNAMANWQQISESSRLVVWLRGGPTVYYLWNVVGSTGVHFANNSGTSYSETHSSTYTFNPTTTISEKAGYTRSYNGSVKYEGRIKSDDRVDAPIFYDSNDTGYYVNPNGSSQLSSVLANDWFRPQGGVGVYWQSHDTRIFSDNSTYLKSRSDNGWQIFDRSANSKGYVYFDSNGFGLLSGPGSWAVNVHPTNQKRVVIGGYTSANAYNSEPGTRLMFGGGNDDAAENYYIGTNLNDYGGNYTKLDLRWHTGIRMGAQPGYGGIRFYDTEDLGTVIFSVGTGDSNVRVTNTLFALGDARAPIFYDQNDTTYYVDPNSGTNTYGRFQQSGAHGNSQIGVRLLAGNNGAGTGEVNLRMWCSEPGVTWDWAGFGYNVTNDGGANGFGRLNASHGQSYFRFSTDGSMYLYNTNTSGTRVTNMEFYANNTVLANNYLTGGNSLRAPIFYDSNDTGYYVNPNSESAFNTGVFYGNRLVVRGGSPTLYFRDTDEMSAMIHCNSNLLYVLRGGVDSEGWSTVGSGSWPMVINLANNNTTFGGDLTAIYGMYAEAFYDRNDTAYRVDPASSSRMNAVRANVYISPYDGGNSGLARASFAYGFGFQENGGWTYPYPDLILQYHTGVTFAANNGYEGMRFKADYNDDTLIFQVNGGSNYLYKYRWMYTTSAGFYSDTNGAHWYPNTNSSYGAWRADGNRNGWYGINIGTTNNPHVMFDGSGNGGFYNETGGRWHHYYNHSNDCVGMNGSSTSASYGLYVSKAIYSTGNIVAYSDRRKKENIETVDNALDTLNKLRGVFYTKTTDETKKRQIGVIAQEVEEVLPEVVTYAADVDEYGVSYGNFAGLFIEAIKEQNEIIENQQKQIEELKEIVNKLILNIKG